jgi:hypothetical protein
MTSPSDAPVISNQLAARLPASVLPPLRDRLRQWNLLFPAEQRLLKAQLRYLDGLPRAASLELFNKVAAVESKMDLKQWSAAGDRVTIAGTAALARSPHYPVWRTEMEEVFERIDSGVGESGSLQSRNRVVLTILPDVRIPEGSSLWPHISPRGKWIKLDGPVGTLLDPLIRELDSRPLPLGLEPIEKSWVIESAALISGGGTARASVTLSFDRLAPLRREFLDRLNAISKSLRSADEAHAQLQEVRIASHLDGGLESEPRVREFVRSFLLSGNGALVFGNPFVQWGSSETLRRVQPQTLIALFGTRPKPKPFSSIVMFEDQSRASPVEEQPDPEGSFTDAQILAEYVQLACDRLLPYHQRTFQLLAAPALDRILVLGPSILTASLPAAMPHEQLAPRILAWLERPA